MANKVEVPIPAPSVDGIKAGVKTSEFWLTIIMALGSLWGQIAGVIPEPWGTVGATVLGAAYTIARAIAKL